jgi:RNA polymerase sigma-70 factor (ECF subfamily)
MSSSALVNGLALRIVRDPHIAEEVTMDVYLQVWRQAAHYDRTRGAPIAWLLTLARSRAIDRLRSAGAAQARFDQPLTSALELADDAAGPEESASVSQCRQAVVAAINLLSVEQRRAIELAYFGGLSHSEIAETLGEPLGTIKTRIRIAMTRLRESLTSAGAAWEMP